MTNGTYQPAGILETLYGGVDMTHINDGGIECLKQGNSLQARFIETLIVSVISIYEVIQGYRQFKKTEFTTKDLNTKRILSSQRRTYLLVILTLVFGIEIGFKLQSKQMIFCFNPCHIFTVMQIYFLASRPTKWMHFLFHSQQPILFGTLLAMIFPETATRHHPLQKEIYWIQHLLIYTIPAQLMPLGGPYSLKDNTMWWYKISIGVGCLYHWIFLQGVSLLTTCNLNFMLCANPDDPFNGPYYRVAAFIYFTLIRIIQFSIQVTIKRNHTCLAHSILATFEIVQICLKSDNGFIRTRRNQRGLKMPSNN